MQRTLLFISLAAAFPLAAQDMKPNKEPVPSRPILENPRGEPIPAPGR